MARRWVTRMPLAAGLLYVAVWIAGLCTWPSNLALDTSATRIATAYRAHDVPAFAQYLLVEGVAGLLIAVVAVTTARRAAADDVTGSRTTAGAALFAGLLAAAVSGTQFALGAALVSAARAGRVDDSHALFDLVNRLDGAKMLLLAAAGACLVASCRRRMPRRLVVVTLLAAVALTASGASYLLLAAGAAWLVYLSGPLLLLWIPSVGSWASRARAPRRDRSPR